MKSDAKSEPVFKNGVFQQAGVVFSLPTIATIIERLRELERPELDKLLAENGFPVHTAMPRDEAEFALGGVIQQSWFFQKQGEVPARIVQTAMRYSERYCSDVERLEKGEPVMATKEKKARKAKVAKEKKQKQVVYLTMNDAAKARAFEDGKYVKPNAAGNLNDSAIGFLIRLMLEEKEVEIANLAELMKKSGYKSESKKKKITFYDIINKLEAKRILSRRKEAVAAA